MSSYGRAYGSDVVRRISETDQLIYDSNDNLVGIRNGLKNRSGSDFRFDASGGSSLVGFIQAGTGAVARTMQDKGREIEVSINDKGGAADNATDNNAPLAAAVTTLGGAGRVRFPLVPGSANIYKFTTFSASNYVGVEFDVDPGVVLSLPSNEIVSDGNVVNNRFARPTRFYFRDLADYYTVSPDGGAVTLDNGAAKIYPYMGAGDADLSFPVAVTASGMTPRKIPWNASDTWAGDAFSASSTSAFSFAPAADSSFHLGMTPCKPGDEFVVSMAGSAAGVLLAACVRHTDGFGGVFGNADYSSAPSYFDKTTGVAGASTTLTFLGAGTHGGYTGAGALWTIRIDSWQSATILLSGYAVARFTTSGYIYECGFGGYPSAGGQTITVSDVVRIRGAQYRGGEFLSVRIYGDSKTADRYDSWPRYFKDAMEFACGVRCWRVTNRAVSGQAVADQKTVMAGDSVSDSNLVIIDIGTNDIQGLTAIASFVSDLTAMVTQAQAAGCNVILGVPSLWYTQAQAGARGQASSNYDKGAPYRSAVLRIAAEKGVRVVDNTRFDGPLLANYVNSALATDLTAAGDPVVYDNIHPTTETNKRRALAYAKAAAAFYANKAGDLYLPPHAVGTAANGWALTVQAPRATVSSDGIVKLYGLVNDPGGATRVDGTTIFNLPAHLCPKDTLRVRATSQANTESILLNVGADGAIGVYGATASTWVSLDGITYSIEDREVL